MLSRHAIRGGRSDNDLVGILNLAAKCLEIILKSFFFYSQLIIIFCFLKIETNFRGKLGSVAAPLGKVTPFASHTISINCPTSIIIADNCRSGAKPINFKFTVWQLSSLMALDNHVNGDLSWHIMIVLCCGNRHRRH